jgi:hypothetical protein
MIEEKVQRIIEIGVNNIPKAKTQTWKLPSFAQRA